SSTASREPARARAPVREYRARQPRRARLCRGGGLAAEFGLVPAHSLTPRLSLTREDAGMNRPRPTIAFLLAALVALLAACEKAGPAPTATPDSAAAETAAALFAQPTRVAFASPTPAPAPDLRSEE